MVQILLRGLATLGLAAGLLILFRLRPALKNTTLPSAWRWLVAGVLLWSGVWFVTVLTWVVPRPAADALWFAVAVVMLCPGIAVLGARRPGSRAWTWFVLLPLLFVLGWPLLVAWFHNGDAVRWQVETPVMLGYVLVLVMGAGNYWGTRWTGASVLLVAALLLLVVPMSSLALAFPADLKQCQVWSTLALSAAFVTAWISARRPRCAFTPYDRLWLDFRDWFGVVWASRIRERLNETARNEHWPMRLEWHGFVAADQNGDRAISAKMDERLVYNLRWLLRRFVDPEWIDARLAGNTAAETNPRTK